MAARPRSGCSSTDDAAIGVLMFFACGYAFAYGDNSNFFLGYEYFFLAHLPDSRYVDFFFQFVFANTSVTIISGALAERTNIWAYVAFSCLMLGFIYPVAAHWVFTDEGWLAQLNFVVRTSAVWSLAALH